MPQVGATAPWGDVERGEERVLRDETTETSAERHRYSGPRPVRASGLDAHPRPTRAIGLDAHPRPARAPRSAASDSDFDFAAARAASAARRRSGPARAAAHFAEPVVEIEPAPVAARPRASRPRPAAPSRPSFSSVSRALRLVAFPGDDPEPRAERPERGEPVARRQSAARDAVEAPPRRTPEGRRIVTITGRGSERYAPVVERRRSSLRAYEREGFRPDRAAMWAVLLGVLMILAAATSAHGAVLAHHAAHAVSQFGR